MSFKLPPLPYPKDALAPYISAETLHFHYGKHHQGYVNKLNGLVEGKPEADKSLEEIIKSAQGGVFNNAAQAWNHTFYWHSMKKDVAAPKGELLEAIKRDLGGLDKFKADFKSAGGSHFGSGWVSLVFNDGKLQIVDTHDADNPLRHGMVPLMTSDLWEHAYYIDYRNNRAGYLEAFVDHLINWDFVQENFEKAKK